MNISIRLGKSIGEALERRLLIDDISLSDFVREAICEKLGKQEDKQSTPSELNKPLLGRQGIGREALSANIKALLLKQLRAKYRQK